MKKPKKQQTNNLFIWLLLNILVLPGLGSVIAKTEHGKKILVIYICSIFLLFLSFPLMFVLIGFLTLPVACLCGFGAWVWGIVDMVQFMQR